MAFYVDDRCKTGPGFTWVRSTRWDLKKRFITLMQLVAGEQYPVPH